MNGSESNGDRHSLASQSILRDFSQQSQPRASQDVLFSTPPSSAMPPPASNKVRQTPAQLTQASTQLQTSPNPGLVSMIQSQFPDLSRIRGLSQYMSLLMNGKAQADLVQETISVSWRGYNTYIEPNLPPFTKVEYRKIFTEALSSIQLGEDEVRFFCFFN